MPSAPGAEEEPMLGGSGINLPATDIAVEGLIKEEQVALALKASVDTIQEEQVARVASLIYN